MNTSKESGLGSQLAGVQYRWHDLSHMFISRLAESPGIREHTIRLLARQVI